jgi:peptide/nickel transport system substrate-binding protein
MTGYEIGKSATLKRRAGYWDGDAALDGIEFSDVGDDPSAAIAALASKQLHGLLFADPVQYEALKALPDLKMYSTPTAETIVMRMKVTEPPFQDARVRKAFRLAIDPTPILEVALHGLGTEGAHHHASVSHPDYSPLPPFKRDVEAAKKLLAEAGHPDGVDAEILVPSDYPWGQAQAEAAVEQWKDANIRVKINTVPGASYWDVWTKVPFGATIWYHRPLVIMTYGLAYRTGGAWNESSYSNPEFDKILEEAEGVLKSEDRRATVAKLEKILQEDGPLIQPLFRNTFTFWDKGVQGFSMHPSNYFFGWQIGLQA